MKTRALVSCLVSSYWVLACGAEAPDQPREPSAPEDEVSVIATAEAVSAAATTSGSGGTSSDGSASAGTSGSNGSQVTTAAANTSASGTSAAGGASATSGSSATDASTTDGSGASGAAGAPVTTAGSGGGSAGEGADPGTDAAASGTGDPSSSAGLTSTTGEIPPPPTTPLGALLITEYVESGGDKAVEISNIGPVALSLSECRLDIYFNGKLESTGGADVAVELAPEQSWVLCNSSSNEPLLAVCDQPTSLNFNGNDALVLFCNGVVHDSFGQLGVPSDDPWQSSETADGAAYTSEDHVLRRRCGALPQTDPFLPFEPTLTDDWVNIWHIQGVTPTGEEFEGLGQSACAEPPVNEVGAGEGGEGGSGAAGD